MTLHPTPRPHIGNLHFWYLHTLISNCANFQADWTILKFSMTSHATQFMSRGSYFWILQKKHSSGEQDFAAMELLNNAQNICEMDLFQICLRFGKKSDVSLWGVSWVASLHRWNFREFKDIRSIIWWFDQVFPRLIFRSHYLMLALPLWGRSDRSRQILWPADPTKSYKMCKIRLLWRLQKQNSRHRMFCDKLALLPIYTIRR